MQAPRTFIALSVLALVATACGGTPAGATNAPGGAATPPGGGAATAGPIATLLGGGGGGNTGGGTGSMHLEIGGPVQKSGDYAFFAAGSRFGGTAGTQLNFTNQAADGIAGVTGINDTWTIGFAGPDLAVNSMTCTRSNWTVGATSASGTFDCKDGFGVKPDGSAIQGVTLKGNFTASQ